jgi:hypothetical protein
MVKRIDDRGQAYHEPPYTCEEQQELYRRTSGAKSLALAHAGPRSPQSPAFLLAERSFDGPEPPSLPNPAATINHDPAKLSGEGERRRSSIGGNDA